MTNKQTSSRISSLAAKVLGGYEPTEAEIRFLAASALSQDEVKGEATPAPEPQPEVAAEPDYWAVHSVTGWNIGLWNKCDVALDALAEYPDGTLTPLYAVPPVVEEAVKAEIGLSKLLGQWLDLVTMIEMGPEPDEALAGLKTSLTALQSAIRARSATP